MTFADIILSGRIHFLSQGNKSFYMTLLRFNANVWFIFGQ